MMNTLKSILALFLFGFLFTNCKTVNSEVKQTPGQELTAEVKKTEHQCSTDFATE